MPTETVSTKTYFRTFGALLGLLALTVGANFVNLGPFSIVVALAISIAKGALIMMFFMEVRYSHPIVWLFATAAFFWLIILLDHHHERLCYSRMDPARLDAGTPGLEQDRVRPAARQFRALTAVNGRSFDSERPWPTKNLRRAPSCSLPMWTAPSSPRKRILTERAKAAVKKMREAGIEFAITSGRPPRGMQMLIEPLAITTPIAAFNGGLFVKPDLSIIEEHVLGQDVVEPIIKIIEDNKLDVWIYRGNDWFVHERHGAHVDREEWTVKFAPHGRRSYEGKMDKVAKIVGVSDDLDAVARCEKAVREAFGPQVGTKQSTPDRDAIRSSTAARSQPYYLDVTHPEANKGGVVMTLAKMLNLQPEEIATIGDMANDVPMFEKSGLSIAMGQANDEVKGAAKESTTSSEDEGFANAVERFILHSNL